MKNIPYYKAKKALEAEVMKFVPPPRPKNWGVSVVWIRCCPDRSHFQQLQRFYPVNFDKDMIYL